MSNETHIGISESSTAEDCSTDDQPIIPNERFKKPSREDLLELRKTLPKIGDSIMLAYNTTRSSFLKSRGVCHEDFDTPWEVVSFSAAYINFIKPGTSISVRTPKINAGSTFMFRWLPKN